MSDLTFALSGVTSFLPSNLPGLKKNYIQAWRMVLILSFYFKNYSACTGIKILLRDRVLEPIIWKRNVS